MVNDQEPRYRLVDADGDIVGSLFAESDGTLKLQEGSSGNQNELTVATDGTVDVQSLDADNATISNVPNKDTDAARLADIAIRPSDNLTLHRDSLVTVNGNEFKTIFDLASPVDITHGVIVGPSIGNVEVVFDDGTNKVLSTQRTRGDTTDDTISFSAEPLPPVKNVTELIFENRDGSARTYGWEVATR